MNINLDIRAYTTYVENMLPHVANNIGYSRLTKTSVQTYVKGHSENSPKEREREKDSQRDKN